MSLIPRSTTIEALHTHLVAIVCSSADSSGDGERFQEPQVASLFKDGIRQEFFQ
jgi:hypothetical protein